MSARYTTSDSQCVSCPLASGGRPAAGADTCSPRSRDATDCRSSFGVYGALWPAFNRAMSAVVWNGVNVVQGGQAVYIMLHAIFPSVTRIPNHMPKASALDTANMMGMILFWLALAGILCISIPKWRILIYIKLVAYVISSCAMLAMALVHSGGVSKELREKPTTHGSERVWLIVRFTLLSAAGCSTFASNASDWQRNARKPNDPIFGQIFGFPMSNVSAKPATSTHTPSSSCPFSAASSPVAARRRTARLSGTPSPTST